MMAVTELALARLNVVVSGGTVVATGGFCGTGIGSGCTAFGVDLTVKGQTNLTATGNTKAQHIGSCPYGSDEDMFDVDDSELEYEGGSINGEPGPLGAPVHTGNFETVTEDNVPKTGDTSGLMFWLILAASSALALAGYDMVSRKRAR